MGVQLSRDYYAFYGPGTASSPAGIDTQLTSDEKQGSSSTTFTPDRPGEIKGMLMAKNVPMISPGWAFSGWVWTWLYNMKTSTGAYIYRDEMNQGKLLGDPFVVSNQIKTSNSGAPTSSDYGDIFYGDWSEFIEFVQLDMELMAFKEMSFVDSDGNTVSAAQQDLTVLRAISLHDFGLRHKESFVEATYKYSLT